MVKTEHDTSRGGIRIVESIDDAERSAIEAVRKFVHTVDSSFPVVTKENPRHKIIDSAFKMVEQLVTVSNDFAKDMMSVTKTALNELERNGTSTRT